MDVSAPFVGELVFDGGSHQVVDHAKRGSILHNQTRSEHLHPYCRKPILGPATDGDESLDRRLPPEHGDRLQEHRRIRARRGETVGDDTRDIGVDVPRPGQELAPERRAAGSFGNRRCRPRIQGRVRSDRDRHCRAMIQWAKRHSRQPIAEQPL
jgi:hypothetical protein